MMVVILAGLLCGIVNAVAGGGSLILFPALVAGGLPTLAANVTNSVATWPGYVGGVLGFREDLKGQARRLIPLTLITLAGSTTGCVLLLTTPTSAFDLVVPALVLFATLLLAAQPRLKRWAAKRTHTASRPRRGLYPAMFLATIYGGYFGGALGVIILGALALTMADSLPKLNALKGVLSLIDCTVSVVIFGLYGPVSWFAVAIAAPSTLIGGYLGARLARRLNEAHLRAAVVTLGLAVTAYFVLRQA
jgi:uncharacterized membrane protein YfcA